MAAMAKEFTRQRESARVSASSSAPVNIAQKSTGLLCFRCGQRGHVAANCSGFASDKDAGEQVDVFDMFEEEELEDIEDMLSSMSLEEV